MTINNFYYNQPQINLISKIQWFIFVKHYISSATILLFVNK